MSTSFVAVRRISFKKSLMPSKVLPKLTLVPPQPQEEVIVFSPYQCVCGKVKAGEADRCPMHSRETSCSRH